MIKDISFFTLIIYCIIALKFTKDESLINNI